MPDTALADTRTLYDELKRSARSTFDHLHRAFKRRTGQAPAQINWYPVSCVSAPAIAEAERVMGVAIPADAAACYEASTGVVETCGWHWWPLHTAVLMFRLMNTVAYELRLGEPGWFAPEGATTADGTVRADAWHRGWLPIAESNGLPYGYFLCIDTAPGPQGQWGQLIEVQDPRNKLAAGEPLQPARRLASGLLAYFEQLAHVLELEPVPEAVRYWAEKPCERRLLLDPTPATHVNAHESGPVQVLRARQLSRLTDPQPDALTAEPALDFLALLTSTATRAARRRGHIVRKRSFCATRVYTGSEYIGNINQSSGDKVNAERWLHQWAHADSSSFNLLVGWHGDGKTNLLLGLVDRLSRACRNNAANPWPFCIDLGLLVNHRFGHAPETLSDAVGAELARRKLPDTRHSVLQAVSDGACVLILDQVEAVAPYHDTVWDWVQQLPPASRGLHRRRARVLMACKQEFFDNHAQLAEATLRLWRCRAGKDELVHMLALQAVDDTAEQAWLKAVGLDLAAEPGRRELWTVLDHGSRALPARAKALHSMLQGTGLHETNWFDVYAAWWRHCMPADLGLDTETMSYHAASIDYASAKNAEDVGVISSAQHAWITQCQWPEASDARQSRLRMWTRIGLMMRVQADGRLQLRQPHRWLACAAVASLEEADIDAVVTGLIEGKRSAAIATAIVQAWFDAGHGQPCGLISQWLRSPRPPRTAGALFQLGCEMARQFAWREARSDRELLRKRTTPKSDISYFHDAFALALPNPLSQACLAGADLRGANCRDVLLEDADLTGASLQGTDFSRARFVRVRLNGACADDALFDETQFVDVEADGLMARNSSWQYAQWNRRWPSADLHGAQLSVEGISPCTTEAELQMHAAAGAAAFPLRSIVLSPDGGWIAAIGANHTLGLWRTHDLAALWHVALPGGPIGKVLSLCFSPDSMHLITSHEDASLRRWSVANGKLSAQLHRPRGRAAFQLVPMIDGDQTFLIGITGSSGAVWTNADLLPKNGIPVSVSWVGSGGICGTVARQRDPQRHFACVRGYRDGGIFDYSFPKPRRKLSWDAPNIWRMATGWDTDSNQEWLAALSADGILIGNPDAKEPRWRVERPNAVIHSAQYLSLAQQALKRMGGFTRNHKPPLLEAHEAIDLHAQVADLAFSPDGRWLVCVGNGEAAFALNTQTGTVHSLNIEASKGAACAVFSTDGQLILGGNDLVHCALPAG